MDCRSDGGYREAVDPPSVCDVTLFVSLGTVFSSAPAYGCIVMIPVILPSSFGRREWNRKDRDN